MEVHNLQHFTKGWFVGNFNPSLFPSKDFEVAIKYYTAGDVERKHYHKIATEITAIVSGQFAMNGKQLNPGDLVVVEPGESVDFKCVESGANVVVKWPSSNGDKYLD